MSERTTGASLEAIVTEACRTYNGLRNPRHGPAVDPDAVAGLAMLIEARATQAGARIVEDWPAVEAALRRVLDDRLVLRNAYVTVWVATKINAAEGDVTPDQIARWRKRASETVDEMMRATDADLDRLAALTEARP